MALSSRFLSIGKGDTKSLGDKVLNSGLGGKYLGEGEYEVTILSVDRNKLSDSKLTLRYAADDGKEHDDMLFTDNTNQKTGDVELGWKFSQVLAACMPAKDCIDALLDRLFAGKEEVLDLLLGMRIKIDLKRGPGYGPAEFVRDVGGNYYIVKDTQDGSVVGKGDSIADAQEAAETARYRKAYVKVQKYTACSGDANIQKFLDGLQAMETPKAPPVQVRVAPQPLRR